MADTVKGSCLCGVVQFEVTLPTLGCCHCHCSISRRFLGAAYGTFFQVPRDQVRLVAGESHLRRHRSSPWAQRAFCASAGPRASDRCPDPSSGVFAGPPRSSARSRARHRVRHSVPPRPERCQPRRREQSCHRGDDDDRRHEVVLEEDARPALREAAVRPSFARARRRWRRGPRLARVRSRCHSARPVLRRQTRWRLSRQATTHSPSSSPKASAIIGRTSTCSAQRRQPGTPVSSPRAKKQPH